MAETVSCPGCQTKLKLKPEYAGKKIKCPKCAQVIVVPGARGVTAAAPKAVAKAGKSVPAVPKAPPPLDDEAAVATEPGRKKGRKSDMSPCPECGEMVDLAATKCPHCKTPLEPDDEDEYKKWKKCPSCRQQKAKQVYWTFWGSFYFTRMFHHVKCEECGAGYNGKTAASNLGPAFVCVSIPFLAMIGLGYFVMWLYQDRGHAVPDWIPIAIWSLGGVGAVGLLAGIVLWLVTGRGTSRR